jgi:DNA polymerase elongation subunit (family B)
MVLSYIDIETYSPGPEPKFSDKVILIYYKEELGGNIKAVFKEWEQGEKVILKDFYNLLKNRIEKEKVITLIGFNHVRFDIPFLTYRLFNHNIDDLENILEVFRKTYWRDLRLCLLPFNKYSFKGLSSDEVAKRFQIEPPKHSNKDIKIFYENKEYKKIEEHTESDMKLLNNLSWKMQDCKSIIEAFSR